MPMRDDEVSKLERLADAPGEGSGEASWVRVRAVELVKSMDPMRFPVGQKQRLLLSTGQGWVRGPSFWLRPLVVGALLMGTGAIASATLTNWPARLLRSYRTFVSGTADSRPRAPAPAQPARLVTKPPAPEPIPSAPVQPSATIRRAPVEAHARRALPVPPSDDHILLIEATRALRVDHDPRLARDLASRYLDRQPHGALADEALAISIEAAIESHDPDAAALSASYLARFPRGSFRGLAERTLASSPDRR
jgi:hypothetical protein